MSNKPQLLTLPYMFRLLWLGLTIVFTVGVFFLTTWVLSYVLIGITLLVAGFAVRTEAHLVAANCTYILVLGFLVVLGLVKWINLPDEDEYEMAPPRATYPPED